MANCSICRARRRKAVKRFDIKAKATMLNQQLVAQELIDQVAGLIAKRVREILKG